MDVQHRDAECNMKYKHIVEGIPAVIIASDHHVIDRSRSNGAAQTVRPTPRHTRVPAAPHDEARASVGLTLTLDDKAIPSHLLHHHHHTPDIVYSILTSPAMDATTITISHH
jgi:hypothetical protein